MFCYADGGSLLRGKNGRQKAHATSPNNSKAQATRAADVAASKADKTRGETGEGVGAVNENDLFVALQDEMPDFEITSDPVSGWHVVIALEGFRGEKEGYTIRSAHFPREFVWKPNTKVRATCLAPRFYQAADGSQYLLNPLSYAIRKRTNQLREECKLTPGWDCSCGFYALKEYDDARRYARPRISPPWGQTIQGIVGGIIVLKVHLHGAVNVYGDHYRGELIEPLGGVMFFGSNKSREAISERYGISIRRALAKEYIGLFR